MRPVVFGDGSGLRAVCFQPGLEDFGVIVAAHRLAFVFRFLGTALDADQKYVFIDLQFKDCVEVRFPWLPVPDRGPPLVPPSEETHRG